jgi:hypothetical protein
MLAARAFRSFRPPSLKRKSKRLFPSSPVVRPAFKVVNKKRHPEWLKVGVVRIIMAMMLKTGRDEWLRTAIPR